jgi:hypothetical protein
MPASEARIRANQQNAARSTGPRTPEGKEASRANAYKHGMTATIVIPEREAAELERRFKAFAGELKPSGEVGRSLVLHATRMSIRMEICADRQNFMAAERVRKALAEIEYPEGIDQAGADRLRNEASDRAMFDPPKEAILARSYEDAATRGFYRALKELRVVEKAARAADAEIEEEIFQKTLASFPRNGKPDAGLAAASPVETQRTPQNHFEPVTLEELSAFKGRVDVPIAVGKRC